MSWIHKLYETYNNCESAVGCGSSDYGIPLLPVCHSTQMAQVEIVINNRGQFSRAKVIPKDDARTIIPCTEESGGRTSGEAAHPLCDKLQYIAGDYISRGGSKKRYFSSYIDGLEKWCDSEYSHPKASAVLHFVKQGKVIGDLIDHQVLFGDTDGNLIPKWEKEIDQNPPPIFTVLKAQEDAFIRWVVEIPGDLEPSVWRDRSLWDSWMHFYMSTKKERTLCYVSGKVDFRAEQHPAKIRHDGDKAKLISSNDLTGFTFRGRFTTASQAASVGLETSQKAHFALRWLIGRQGFRQGDLAIVAWATSGASVPQPTNDALSILGLDDLPNDPLTNVTTAQEVAIKFKKKLAGYGKELGDTTDVVVIGVDSATTGRLAISYYLELTGSTFLDRINTWHESCAWLHRYRSIEMPGTKGIKGKSRIIPFVGAPAPNDIADAAYGKKKRTGN